MDSKLKKILRAVSLEIRRLLEGRYDEQGNWVAGDLERRLNELGVWRDRNAIPIEELSQLNQAERAADKSARRLVDGYLKLREEAGVARADAVAEFVRESAYTWANRLFALRCMEARGIIDEVILQKEAYGWRSMVHYRLAKKNPDACAGDDDGLFTVLFTEFEQRGQELPAGFDPKSPAVALRPSVAALKKTIALLSGRETARGQDAATDEVFAAPDAFGWAYQYWNTDEKARVFEMLRTVKDAEIQGADIVPATQFYTEPYMVKFLVQNSLGALWTGMYPDSKLCEQWEYFVKDADRASVTRKPVRELTFFDPAQGSGHFHLEAFDLLYAMYEEEAAGTGQTLTPREICAAILNRNLFGVDIDGRSVQIATAALWMKAKERAPELEASDLTTFHDHLVATNIRLPKGKDHLQIFLQKHHEDEPLRPALELVFQGLEHADELGSLLQIEELVDAVLRRLKEQSDKSKGVATQPGLFEKTLVQGTLAVSVEDYGKWKRDALNRLQAHFESEAQTADTVQAFFGEAAGKGLKFFDVLSGRYDAVAANPPYMGSKNMGGVLLKHLNQFYPQAKYDLYTSFIVRARQFLTEEGVSALVTMQSFFYTNRFEELREYLLTTSHLTIALHLGANAFPEMKDHVLAVCTLWQVKGKGNAKKTLFIDVRDEKDKILATQLAVIGETGKRYLIEEGDLDKLPGKPFLYDLPRSFIKLFGTFSALGDHLDLLIREGIHSKPYERFLRMVWEYESPSSRWHLLSVGGARRKWAGLDDVLVDFEICGIRIKQMPAPIVPSEELYLRGGLSYSDSGGSGFSCRVLPGGAVFSDLGPAIISKSGSSLLSLLSYLNSAPVCFLLDALNPSNHYKINDVKRLPLPKIVMNCDQLSTIAQEAVVEKQKLLSLDPASREFCWPFVQKASLAKLASSIRAKEWEFSYSIIKLENELDQLVADKLQLDSEAVAFINKNYRTNLWMANRQADATFLETIKEFSPKNIPFNGSEAKMFIEYPIELVAVLCQMTPESSKTIFLSACDGVLPPFLCVGVVEDYFSATTLRLLGHRWPKQIQSGEPLPAWADQDGVIPLTSGGGETPLIDRVRQRLAEDFPGGNLAALQQEFEVIIVGTSLASWLAGPFFERHISQFKKRPIAWQLKTQPRTLLPEGKRKKGVSSAPVFSCLLYYHKLDADLLPKIRTQYVGTLQGGFETEQRTLERMPNRTPEQESRRLQLDAWIEEMRAFDAKLEQVTVHGFGPESLRPALRQFAIADALLSLTAGWLKKLNGVVDAGPLKGWQAAAGKTNLHPDVSMWVGEAFQRLDYFCAAVGPEAPEEKTFATDPTSKDLAPLVCATPEETVGKVLELACDRWRHKLDEVVLDPLKEQLKQKKDESDRIKDELKLDDVRKDYERAKKLADRQDELKREIKTLRGEIDEKTDTAKRLRREIESWTCAEAATWEKWLGTQPLFDTVASLDGQRPSPLTIAEFIVQESLYAPDINDGVRVNISPLQKAGLLHAEVLDAKDADRAIADRAEWRADERRWVREGKLPQPGWWVLADGH